jgi:hypothetical protein
MLPAIKFHNQSCIEADKVGDVAADWSLSPE